ncbi:HsmA family protein [Adlercreutzia caecimuris]|uniref:HsmA family protein n=1 Tax=Adlercreutzia caecimuris TaxID=671266 RepID=UPI002494F6E9|nr:HsmA family protein [Adlercreutzia caecimuris]
MSPELIVSTVAISLALLFYTWGVFGERRHGSLNLKYVLLFWAGLACDTTGTLIMSNIASQSNATGFGIHGLTGALAIVLMIVHALWATFTYLRGSQQARRRFHTFSTVVWLLWLVPYIIGMLVGIPAIHLKAVCAIGTAIVVVGLLTAYLFARDRSDDKPRSSGHGHGPAASR